MKIILFIDGYRVIDQLKRTKEKSKTLEKEWKDKLGSFVPVLRHGD